VSRGLYGAFAEIYHSAVGIQSMPGESQLQVDVTQALRDTENALREFIAATLERALGRDWLDSCGVSQERITKWKDRQSEERRRHEAGVVEERLLYYADFYDLKTILKKHWQRDFSEALGDLKRFEVLFDELARYRDLGTRKISRWSTDCKWSAKMTRTGSQAVCSR